MNHKSTDIMLMTTTTMTTTMIMMMMMMRRWRLQWQWWWRLCMQGRQSWGLGVTNPRFWAGIVGVAGGGREILLYLIMYRKYVRKWLHLKRNRIIWPEVRVQSLRVILTKLRLRVNYA